MGVYNEYNWLPWRFSSAPNGYWSDHSNQKLYINWLAEQIGIKSIEDWYNVDFKVRKI